MNYCTASKIQRGNPYGMIPNAIHKTRTTPNHVRQWKINQKHPETDKDQYSGKFHPLRNRTKNQRGSNDREHELIHAKYTLRNPESVVCVRRSTHVFEKKVLRAA